MGSKVRFTPGAEVEWRGRRFVVVRATSPTRLLLRDKATGETEAVHHSEVTAPSDGAAPPPARPIDSLGEDDLAEARRRLALIQPLLSCSRGRMELLAKIAAESGVGRSTLRDWVRKYEDRGLLSDLAPRRKGRKMPTRLSKKAEQVIAAVIEEFYLTLQKRSQTKAIAEVKRRCRALRIAPPSDNAIRRRIKAVDEKTRVARRHGRKAARDRFEPVKGSFPGADFPLAVVQIDHTLLDIILVDDEQREPIGRPWLTLAIDGYSRMVTGLSVSLDPPSAHSVGLCVTSSVLAKEPELDRLGVKGEWPVWGFPRVLHADNGKDFRSNTLKMACDEYGINLAWRPVATPHYGGYIERMMGTVAKEIHSLPGTTFSNPAEKGAYKPDKNAVMTLDELTRWLVEFFVNEYHLREHRGIGMAPIEKWRRGILGDGRRKGTGLPDPAPDPWRLYLDFLPFERRTVQSEGIVWGRIYYSCDALKPWVRARKGGVTQKFVVRRDPRDISRVWFLDPGIGEYIEVPYRETERPSVSQWEYEAAKRALENEGLSSVTPGEVFASIDRRREIVEAAQKETRRVRRERQRKKHAAQRLATLPAPPPTAPAGSRPSLVVDNTAPKKDAEFDFSDDDLRREVEEW